MDAWADDEFSEINLLSILVAPSHNKAHDTKAVAMVTAILLLLVLFLVGTEAINFCMVTLLI
jgi:hypothetical protein